MSERVVPVILVRGLWRMGDVRAVGPMSETDLLPLADAVIVVMQTYGWSFPDGHGELLEVRGREVCRVVVPASVRQGAALSSPQYAGWRERVLHARSACPSV